MYQYSNILLFLNWPPRIWVFLPLFILIFVCFFLYNFSSHQQVNAYIKVSLVTSNHWIPKDSWVLSGRAFGNYVFSIFVVFKLCKNVYTKNISSSLFSWIWDTRLAGSVVLTWHVSNMWAFQVDPRLLLHTLHCYFS